MYPLMHLQLTVYAAYIKCIYHTVYILFALRYMQDITYKLHGHISSNTAMYSNG